MGKQWKQCQALLFGAPKSLQMVIAVMKSKMLTHWTPGVGDGQGGLACCGSWGRKELDTTERLN